MSVPMSRVGRIKSDGVVGKPILFYRPSDDYGTFSNFSDHEIYLVDPWTGKLRRYATGEHRFQAMKATLRTHHDFVWAAKTSSEAKRRGGPEHMKLRGDWGSEHNTICWFVMLEICIAKALRHNDVWDDLESTEGQHIYEDSPVDAIWGWRRGKDFSGKNLLGRAWMEVRSIIFADGR